MRRDRCSLIMLAAVMTTCRWLMASFPSEVTCPGPFNDHQQGLAYDGMGSIFWSQGRDVIKTDLAGNELARITDNSFHWGDLDYYQGKVYVAVTHGGDPSDQYVYVYDAADLSYITRGAVPETTWGAGGLGIHDGRVIVVGHLPEELGIDENYAYEYDIDLNYVQTHTINSGYTMWGIQTATWSDGYWWFACYGMPDNPALLVTDNNFNLVCTYYIDGLDYPFAGVGYGFAGIGGGRFLQTIFADGRSDPRRATLESYGFLVPGPPSPALLNHWKFDDTHTVGTETWTSNSAGPEDGRVFSDVTHHASGGASFGYMHFNGGLQEESTTAESRIQVDPAAVNDLGTNAVTLSCWVRITDAEFDTNSGENRFNPVMIRAEALGPAPEGDIPLLGTYCPLRDDLKRVYFFTGDPDAPTQCISDTLARTDFGTDGTWHHYAMTADRTTGIMKIYHNGSVIKTATDQTGPMPITYTWFAMGCSQASETTWVYSSEFDLDDVQIYAAALSDDQIAWLAANPGLPVPAPATIALLGLGARTLIRRRRNQR